MATISNQRACADSPQEECCLEERVNEKSRVDNSSQQTDSVTNPFGPDKISMNFPAKIMCILSHSAFSKVIFWNRDGTEFCLFPDPFTTLVLDPHFQRTKLHSFTRKLNRWGFKRVYNLTFHPEGSIAYRHPMFRRGRDDLLQYLQMDEEKLPKKTKFSLDQDNARKKEIQCASESIYSQLRFPKSGPSNILSSPRNSPIAQDMLILQQLNHIENMRREESANRDCRIHSMRNMCHWPMQQPLKSSLFHLPASSSMISGIQQPTLLNHISFNLPKTTLEEGSSTGIPNMLKRNHSILTTSDEDANDVWMRLCMPGQF